MSEIHSQGTQATSQSSNSIFTYLDPEAREFLTKNLRYFYSEDDVNPLDPEDPDDPPYRDIYQVTIRDSALGMVDLENMSENGPYILIGEVDKDEVDDPPDEDKTKMADDDPRLRLSANGRLPMWTLIYEWNLEFRERQVMHWVQSAKSWWRILNFHCDYERLQKRVTEIAEPLRFLVIWASDERRVNEEAQMARNKIPLTPMPGGKGGESDRSRLSSVLSSSSSGLSRSSGMTSPGVPSSSEATHPFIHLLEIIAESRRETPQTILSVLESRRTFCVKQLETLGFEESFAVWVLKHPTAIAVLRDEWQRARRTGRGFWSELENGWRLEKLPSQPTRNVWACPSQSCGYITFASCHANRMVWLEHDVISHVRSHQLREFGQLTGQEKTDDLTKASIRMDEFLKAANEATERWDGVRPRTGGEDWPSDELFAMLPPVAGADIVMDRNETPKIPYTPSVCKIEDEYIGNTRPYFRDINLCFPHGPELPTYLEDPKLSLSFWTDTRLGTQLGVDPKDPESRDIRKDVKTELKDDKVKSSPRRQKLARLVESTAVPLTSPPRATGRNPFAPSAPSNHKYGTRGSATVVGNSSDLDMRSSDRRTFRRKLTRLDQAHSSPSNRPFSAMVISSDEEMPDLPQTQPADPTLTFGLRRPKKPSRVLVSDEDE